MKAVVLEETRKIAVREVPDAQMRDAADILEMEVNYVESSCHWKVTSAH